MKKLLVAALALGAIGSAMAETSVGLSIGINQPGVYGQVNIGTLPAPALVAPRPVLIAPGPSRLPPAYLYVPAAERHNWRHSCAKYGACGKPVYFVREDWVRARYTREHPGWDRRGPPARHVEHRPDDRRDHHERHD